MAHFIDQQREHKRNEITKEQRITGKGQRVAPGNPEKRIREHLLIVGPAHPGGWIDHVDVLKAHNKPQHERIPDEECKDRQGRQQEQIATKIAPDKQACLAQDLELTPGAGFLHHRGRRSFHGYHPPEHEYLLEVLRCLTSRRAAVAERRAADHCKGSYWVAPTVRATDL